MPDDIIDNLINEDKQTELMVNGKKYIIKKFNAITMFRLGKLIAKVGKAYQKDFMNFAGQESNAADIIILMDMLSTEDFIELVSIFLNEPDKTLCAQIEMDDLFKAIELICKYNDFMALLKNVIRVMSQAVKLEKKLEHRL